MKSNHHSNKRAPRNKTITLAEHEKQSLNKKLVTIAALSAQTQTHSQSKNLYKFIQNKTIHGELLDALALLPAEFVDLLILDPPYNLDKNFHGFKFAKQKNDAYFAYLKSWFEPLLKTLKPNASVYVCCDWQNSSVVYTLLNEFLFVRNRITWQREKGRGAKTNWKNSSEDIWFATVGRDYYFNVDAVKMKRRVIAPYKKNGQPKDWQETDQGNFRLTHPGNFWDDLSIPYWSMPENTDHPTQKPEKLIAKLILASSPVQGFVLDPFLGSGTTSVTAKKLGRLFLGIEMNHEYCLWAQKRLEMADKDNRIQGYTDGVFWERNSLNAQNKKGPKYTQDSSDLFS